jgi:glycosidase
MYYNDYNKTNNMNLRNLKLKTSMLNIIFLASLLTFGACKEDPVVVVDPPVVVNPDTAQYGTPFTGVPDARDAVIYQVNMRSFSSTRNFQGVISRLDSIKALGVNVIYLMPIYPIGALKSVNSPYAVKDYKGVNAEFGTLADLRALIDGAHNRGMSVILDWVANHTSWDNAWISNTAWYVQNASGAIQSPSGWNDVAQLNFKNTEMRKAMIKAMKYWVYAANCDGFRCDYADGPPADFWKQAIDTLRNIKTHKLLMMAEGSRTDLFSSGFNLTFGFNFYGQFKSVFGSNQAVTNLDALNTSEYANAGTSNMVVRYLTNHDVNSSDGTALDLFGGKTGSMAAFVVVAYMKGVPMIYNGQEVGTTYRLTFPFTGTTINWNQNQSMVEEYKKIIAFRNSSLAIRRGTLASYSNANVCAFTKTSGTETVLVICNLRNSTQNFTVPTVAANSTWKNAFTDASVTLGTQLSLSPYSYQVYKK